MATPARIVANKLPTVALVGRVNVGKSSLFNRLAESSLALVSKIPGTTRTRNMTMATWRGQQFRVIDTGGLTFTDSVPLEADIIHQTELALTEADVIVLVTDIQEGVLPQEYELAARLRKISRRIPVMVVANKADTPKLFTNCLTPEWKKLGLGSVRPVSAVTSTGIGDWLDDLYDIFTAQKKEPHQPPTTAALKVALVGRPNVGKSSLFNKLIGEDRVIVSNMPHTTREPHDLLVNVDGRDIIFIDTAGIRRKTKVSGELERMGIGKSLKAMERADVVVLVLDATEPVMDQDQQLAGWLREHAKSTVLVINKWDEAEDNTDEFRNEVKDYVYKAFPHLRFAPMVLVSAKTGYRVHQLFPLLFRADAERSILLDQDELNRFWKEVSTKRLPTKGKGVRHPKILGFRQLAAAPPIFEILIKYQTSLHSSYINYLTNRLRERYGFFAAPIIIKLTKVKRS